MAHARIRGCPIIAALVLVAAAVHAQEPNNSRDLPELNPLWGLFPFLPPTAAPSKSMEPAEFDLTNSMPVTVRLLIPKGYIVWVPHAGQTQQEFLNLAVYLPDYLPTQLAREAGFKVDGELVNGFRLRSDAQILIKLEPSIPGALRKSIEGMIPPNTLPGGREFGEEFDAYYNKRVHPDGSATPEHFGYLIPKSGDGYFHFTKNPNTGELTGIEMHFDVQGCLAVTASFSGRNLHAHSEIRKNVSDLVRGFVLGEMPRQCL